VIRFRHQLDLHDPFIVENGGAIHGESSLGEPWDLPLGPDWSELKPQLSAWNWSWASHSGPSMSSPMPRVNGCSGFRETFSVRRSGDVAACRLCPPPLSGGSGWRH
jgi:hypothetical protein